MVCLPCFRRQDDKGSAVVLEGWWWKLKLRRCSTGDQVVAEASLKRCAGSFGDHESVDQVGRPSQEDWWGSDGLQDLYG